jgi:neurotransmitter:Na+ symporter, NSS family
LVLAPLFFLLVGFAALTSTISLLEVVVAYFIDEKGWGRHTSTFFCGGIAFLVSMFCALSFGASDLLSNFEIFAGKAGLFATLDHLASNWMLPIGGLMITIGVGWFMKKELSETELMEKDTPVWFHYGIWRFMIRYIAPAAVAAIITAVMFFGVDFS